MINIINIHKYVLLGVVAVLSFSCRSTQIITSGRNDSPVCELYTWIEYNREKELLLRIPDSTYMYYEKYLGIEIGLWKRVKDSLFLYPQIYIHDSHEECEKFGKIPPEYDMDSSFANITIPYRLYIYAKKEEIKDCTLEHFHIENKIDEDDFYVQEIRTPLKKRMIKSLKEEKRVMKRRHLYGENFF